MYNDLIKVILICEIIIYRGVLIFVNSMEFVVTTLQQHLHVEYISQLIRYSWVCVSYYDLLDIGLLLAKKQLLHQLFLMAKRKSSLGKCYGQHHDLVTE
jgi:hypothetical protein